MADTQTKEQEQKTPEQPGGNQPTDQANPPSNEAPKTKRNPIIYVIGAVVVLVLLIYGIKSYLFNRVHVSTDDAYVTGDLVNVSPQINGTLQQLMVQEGDSVTKGQLIAVIDPSGPQASLRQAQANYEAAMSQVPAAEQNLRFQQLSTQAAIRKAQAALGSQQSKSIGAREQVSLTAGTFSNSVEQARAQVRSANSSWQQARAQVDSAIAAKEIQIQAIQTAQDALANYEQQVQTAQKAMQSANARAAAAGALAQKAIKDLQRSETLYSEDAIAAQTLDQARATAQSDAAQFEAAKSDVQQAESQVASAQKAAVQASSQVEQARRTEKQANAQVSAAQRAAEASRQQVKVSQAGLGLAQANAASVSIEQSNLNAANQQVGEAQADVSTAKSGEAQVIARQEAVKTARAQAVQARAALTNAQITLGDTQIIAPNSGHVVRKDSNVGSTLAPGSTIVTISKGDHIWVTANFKETQLADVRPGEPAEVEVDAFPGKVFKGKVRDITDATGASTALLPPDNATGNFTKVVQRVPVRIDLLPASGSEDKNEATAEDIANLRQGLSVTATIDTGHKDDYPRQSNLRADQNGTLNRGGARSPGDGANANSQGGASENPPDVGGPSGSNGGSQPMPDRGPQVSAQQQGAQPSQPRNLPGQMQPGGQLANPGSQPQPGRNPAQPGSPQTPNGAPGGSSPPSDSAGPVPGATGTSAGTTPNGPMSPQPANPGTSQNNGPNTPAPAGTGGVGPAGGVGSSAGGSGAGAH